MITKNKKGKFEGFDYELWSQMPEDYVRMNLTGGGTFSCDWNAYNALFRTGKRLGNKKNYKEYGSMTVDYAATHKITSGDVSYLCLYGWTVDPLIEFYVVDNYFSYKPPGGKGFTGELELDGGVYEVFTDTRVEQPSIHGTKTFQQIFSVRKERRTEGVITLSDHFKEWESMGFDVGGKLYEIALCVEGFRAEGSAVVNRHLMQIGGEVWGK